MKPELTTFHYRELASSLPSHIGENLPDGARVSLGQSGILSFGPHIGLEAGLYFAGFELQKLSPFQRGDKLVLDAAAQDGRRILARRIISDSDLFTDVPVLVTLRMNLEQATGGVEVRLQCVGKPRLKVLKLVIFSNGLSSSAKPGSQLAL